jgi:hypothetical protein
MCFLIFFKKKSKISFQFFLKKLNKVQTDITIVFKNTY